MRSLRSTKRPTLAISDAARAVLVISLCSIFFFYKYILQNFPSVMAPELMEAFHLHGLGLGVLSGVYFWTYLIVPLFVGVLLDRYGTRWLTTAAIGCCAVGILFFSQAVHLNTAIIGRTLIGVGVSFATITYLKLAAVWFHRKYYALLTSLLITAGMLGAIFGQTPLAWFIHHMGWRTSLADLGWVGLIVAVLFAIFVRDEPTTNSLQMKHSSEPQSIWQDIVCILCNKQNWLLTGYGGLAFAPVVIFCGLWGNPFLQKAYHLDKLLAPSLISLVFLGLAIASPLCAALGNRIHHRIRLMCYSTFLSAACISLVIYAHPLPIWLLAGLLFLYGFSLGAFPLVFVIGKEINPLHLAGTAISLINASDAFLDAVTEPLIGKLLDYFGHVTGSHEFTLFGYHIALALLPLYQVIGIYLLSKVKEHD